MPPDGQRTRRIAVHFLEIRFARESRHQGEITRAVDARAMFITALPGPLRDTAGESNRTVTNLPSVIENSTMERTGPALTIRHLRSLTSDTGTAWPSIHAPT